MISPESLELVEEVVRSDSFEAIGLICWAVPSLFLEAARRVFRQHKRMSR